MVDTEPVVGAQAPPVQELQFFVAESTWEAEALNARRLELLVADPATAPDENGVLVIDDTGDRKDSNKTAHVARQYLGSVGKVDNGIVAVTSLWADDRVYYPLHVQPCTPAERLPLGKKDPAFRTKPQIAVEFVDAALSAGFTFRAIVSDCMYGENVDFETELSEAGLPYVLGLKSSKGIWAPAEPAHTPKEAESELRWGGPEAPGDWTKVVRRFRDGYEEIWWAAELTYGPYGSHNPRRIVAATTDPATLPELTTWYLAVNLPRPGSLEAIDSPIPAAELAAVVRIYGLRNWIAQGYKQIKNELGWADFMVRSDQVIRGHWHLVYCAFSFIWQSWFNDKTEATGPDIQVKQTALTEAVDGESDIDEDGPLQNQRWRGGKIQDQPSVRGRNVPSAGTVSWPTALRLVRGWLYPRFILWRCWQAGAGSTAPPELQALFDWVGNGRPINLYLRC